MILTAIYAFSIAAAILASIVMSQLALRQGMVATGDPPVALRTQPWDSLATPAVFLVSIPITYAGVAIGGTSTVGKLCWLLTVVVGPLSGRLAERAPKRARTRAGLGVAREGRAA